MKLSSTTNMAVSLYEKSELSKYITNTMEDEQHLHSLSFMPLLSRVDCLDSVIKDVEKKKKQEQCSVWSSGARKLIGRRCSRQGGLPLTTATREAVAASKASLMDRVRSLEDRLLQLSQEIDHASSKASSSSSILSTSLWTTSSSSCAQLKSDLPYPTFHTTRESRLPCHEYFQKPLAPRHRMKNPGNGMQQKAGKVTIIEKDCFNQKRKNKKKKTSPCWPHMKLLGCY